jgi:hypothetical protein
MSMYSLHIFSYSEIPDSSSLVTTATSKNTFMSWMPLGLVNNKIMRKLGLTTWCQVQVPHSDCSIVWPTQYLLLVYMIPFYWKDLTCMLFKHPDRLIIHQTPKKNRTIALCRKELLRIAFIKCYVITCILSLPLSY